MKKLVKFFKITLIIFLIFTVLAAGALYLIFPPKKIKAMAQDYIRNNYSREIEFDNISFTLIGVKLHNFKISEFGTFDDGTFTEAKSAVLKLNLFSLFNKEINVSHLILNGVKINIIKEEDGTFNFDSFIKGEAETQPQAQTNTETSSNFKFKAEDISLQDSSLHYLDKQSKIDFAVDKLNIFIDNFSLTDFFNFAVNFDTSFNMADISVTPIIINLHGKATLENLDLQKAYIDISPFVISYKTAKTIFTGKMQDFTNPVVNLDGKIEGIDNKVITSITPMDLPAFSLAPLNVSLKANIDLDNSKAKVTKADLELGKSYIKNEADVDFSSENLIYKVNTNLNISLNDIYESIKELLKDIKPYGNIIGTINTVSANPSPKVKGKISLKNIAASIMNNELKNFNGDINISSISDISTNVMGGTFNNSKFMTSLAYVQPQNAKATNLEFMLDLDKFTLDDINFDELLAPKTIDKNKNEPAKTEKSKQNNYDFGMYNIKTDVRIKEVSNNVLTANNLVLKADLKNFANDLSNLQGTLNFSSSNGEIRDINKLMSSSKIIRAAFSVVQVIQKVFSVAQLQGLSLGNNNVIKYTQIEGAYTIKDGVANLDKSIIVSNLLTVKASGTVDLVLEKLNMKVDTHFGKVTGSGFKPVVLKIKGTMNDPKYSVDVLSTVTSLVNIPSGIIKGGVKMSTNTASGVASGLKGVASTIGKLF